MHDQNSFITLTYNDDNLPHDESVDVREFQLFMKKLRSHIAPRKVRYFHCGEYGENLSRPHYHACLFGYDFPDKKLIKDGENKLYTSPTLSRLWGKGYVTIGDVNFKTAAYVARYVLKKMNGQKKFDHYNKYNPETGELYSSKRPEYTTMSRRPGIGKQWFDKYKTDVYPSDEIIINGLQVKPPKYYDQQIDEIELLHIKNNRLEQALKNASDNTTDRLLVKEKIKQSKLKQLKRSYHAT